MLCERAQELLSEARYAATPGAAPAELGEHLATCAHCQAAQARQAALDALLGADVASVPSPDFDARFFARLQLERTQARRRQRMRYVFGLLPLAAAVALAVVRVPKHDAAHDAVANAARDGARDSARDPARDGAHDSARDSTRDAAHDSARDSARDAAHDSARDAPPSVLSDPQNGPLAQSDDLDLAIDLELVEDLDVVEHMDDLEAFDLLADVEPAQLDALAKDEP